MNSMRMQYVFIVLTVLFLSFLLAPLMRRFYSTDPIERIEYVLPEQQKSINFARVETGLIITDFLTFDPRENKFEIDAVIWFSFDSSKISLEAIDKFSFLNGIIESKSDPSTELLHNRLMVRYSIRVSFTTELDYRLFPLDDHRIGLTLVNKHVTPDELIYQVKGSDFVVSSNMLVYGWDFYDKYVEYGYVQVDINALKTLQYPVAVFSIDFQKVGTGSLIPILVPLMIMFFMAVICFSLIAIGKDDAALPIALANETGMIGYLFVLQTLVPRVGYFTFANYLFIYIFIVSFLALAVSIFVFKTKKKPRWVFLLDRIGVPMIYLLLFVLIYVSLYALPKGF